MEGISAQMTETLMPNVGGGGEYTLHGGMRRCVEGIKIPVTVTSHNLPCRATILNRKTKIIKFNGDGIVVRD